MKARLFLPGDGLAFNEGLELTQAFLALRRVDARVGQADVSENRKPVPLFLFL